MASGGFFWNSKSRRSSLGSRWVIPCLVAFAVVGQAGANAENTRGFSATYDFGSAQTVDPTHVSVKLFLRIRNHSGTDLSNATISLTERLEPARVLAPVATGVSVPLRGMVKVSGSVTVDKREYWHWQRGEQPSLVIRLPLEDGRSVDRPIELTRMPGIGATR